MKQERLITRKEERQVCNRCGKDITNEEHYTFLLNYSYKWFEKSDGKPTVVQSDFAPDYCVDCARAFSAEFRHLNLEFNT